MPSHSVSPGVLAFVNMLWHSPSRGVFAFVNMLWHSPNLSVLNFLTASWHSLSPSVLAFFSFSFSFSFFLFFSFSFCHCVVTQPKPWRPCRIRETILSSPNAMTPRPRPRAVRQKAVWVWASVISSLRDFRQACTSRHFVSKGCHLRSQWAYRPASTMRPILYLKG